ncbi:MAG TPA: T9SS type A sorting domain-containing protein, partial [Bacteroidia bacterium]|nr:T9SS type A sorting domain-containing protein [Bacteroidia bacterium]
AGDSALLIATCNVPAAYSWAPSATLTNPSSDSTYAHPTVTTQYTVTIITPCGIYKDTVTINIQCFPLAMSSTPSYFSCTSSYDGTATVSPSGGTPPYTYLWTPGGGATATITGLYPAVYTVSVHDNTGCSATASVSVSSASVSLTVNAVPPTINAGDSSYLSASLPIVGTFVWAPAIGLSCTSCANPIASPTVTTTYTVTATDTCGTLTDSITVYVATCTNNYNESICIVTVDTANKPVIIWGRTNSPPQSGYGSYVVYKETAPSVFTPIDNQPLNILSDYIDAASNPSLGPISYKLATDDSCGESALSPMHTTIYLTLTSGVNVNILNWTGYVGFTPSKYRIYRGLSMSTLVQIDSVPSTVLTYHDTLPPAGVMYLVEAVNPSSLCIPTARVAPHNASVRMLSGSLSNGSTKAITGAQTIVAENVNLNIFPNPSNGPITISCNMPQNANVQINIINELGQMVYSENKYMNSGSNSEQINLENLSSGIYSLRMQTTNSITVKKLVVMKK